MGAYQRLYKTGELRDRVFRAREMLKECKVCPRQCKVNRLQGETGKCYAGALALVSSYGPHFGEESPLTGWRGSGTIFFSSCSLRCVFCQNYSISQLREGVPVTAEALASMMLSLQVKGCHNINLVSPTHVVPQILEALGIAAEKGLSIPLVYNTGGYDSIDTLRLLDGIVDIYMPDMKYSDEMTARRYSGVKNYPSVNREAVKEMHRQVGDLQLDGRGLATRGLLVRHLVLPNGLAGTREVVRFLAEEISTNTYLNLMDQYYPSHRVLSFPNSFHQLARRITSEEYLQAVRIAYQYGIRRLDGIESPAILIRNNA